MYSAAFSHFLYLLFAFLIWAENAPKGNCHFKLFVCTKTILVIKTFECVNFVFVHCTRGCMICDMPTAFLRDILLYSLCMNWIERIVFSIHLLLIVVLLLVFVSYISSAGSRRSWWLVRFFSNCLKCVDDRGKIPLFSRQPHRLLYLSSYRSRCMLVMKYFPLVEKNEFVGVFEFGLEF